MSDDDRYWVSPNRGEMPRYLESTGLRISMPIRRTFLPSTASEAAMLTDMKLLPSPGDEDVSSTTRSLLSFSINSRLDRMSLKSSAAEDVLPSVTINFSPEWSSHISPRRGMSVAFSTSLRCSIWFVITFRRKRYRGGIISAKINARSKIAFLPKPRG